MTSAATIPPKWRVRGQIACVAISLLGLILVFLRIDLPGLGQALSRARLSWIGAAWAIFGVAFAFAAIRWHLVLQLNRCEVHGTATGRAVLVGHLFNTILLGPTGGDIAKSAFYSRKYGFATSSILATCALDRFLGGLGFVIFVGCTPGFAFYSQKWNELFQKWTASPQVLMMVVCALLLLAGMVFAVRHVTPLSHLSNAFVSSSEALIRSPGVALRGIALAVLSHLAISCVFLFSVKAVTHGSISMASLFWVFPVISLITSAPVTVAGAGLREGAALFFLGKYGIPASDAVAASLLVLITYLVWAVIGAILFWRTLRPHEVV